MAASLQSKLDAIRTLKAKGSTFEVQAMYEVMTLEKQTVLWRRDGTKTFDEMLREQSGVCTPSRFRDFKKAADQFPRATIDKLGVGCVCLIAKQNANKRESMLKRALEFQKTFGVEPNVQFFSRQLRDPSKKIVSRKRLLNYIDLLKAEIRSMGGRVPTME